MTKTSWVFLAIVAVLGIAGAFWYQNTREAPSEQQVGIANPASVNCVNLGGRLELVADANGSAGYCHLPDGRVCEEWSLMRGGCAAPGDAQ